MTTLAQVLQDLKLVSITCIQPSLNLILEVHAFSAGTNKMLLETIALTYQLNYYNVLNMPPEMSNMKQTLSLDLTICPNLCAKSHTYGI